MQVGDLVRPKFDLHKGVIGVVMCMDNRNGYAKVVWNLATVDPNMEYWLLEVI